MPCFLGFLHAMLWRQYTQGRSVITPDSSHKFHNAPILYPTTHHIITEMCTHVHISVINGALWDIWIRHCGICETGLLSRKYSHQRPHNSPHGRATCMSCLLWVYMYVPPLWLSNMTYRSLSELALPRTNYYILYIILIIMALWTNINRLCYASKLCWHNNSTKVQYLYIMSVQCSANTLLTYSPKCWINAAINVVWVTPE